MVNLCVIAIGQSHHQIAADRSLEQKDSVQKIQRWSLENLWN